MGARPPAIFSSSVSFISGPDFRDAGALSVGDFLPASPLLISFSKFSEGNQAGISLRRFLPILLPTPQVRIGIPSRFI